jgi:uncharacterized protein YbaP (TraB family)
MRRQIIVMFFGLFWLMAGAGAAEQARGALFKVQSGDHTLYLFGTMHMGRPDFYPLEARISGAVAHASVLALEVDPGRDPAEAAQDMARYGLLAAGSRNYAALPAAQRERLEQVLAQRQIALAAVSQLKPWLLATVLAIGEFSALGYRAELAVDAHLARLAREHQVPLLELESNGAQLALFGRMKEDEQWQFLADSVDAIASGKQGAQVRDIVQAWGQADQRALDAIALEAQQDQSVSGRFIWQVLLVERNAALADKLAALLLRERAPVAALGVLHLVGAHSIPALLRARGLAVERIY